METKVENPKTENAKNLIVLYTGYGKEKQRVELYNFESVDHYTLGGVSYIRVCCDGRFYYYRTIESVIHSIVIYNR